MATLANYTCKSFIQLTPGVLGRIESIFSGAGRREGGAKNG